MRKLLPYLLFLALGVLFVVLRPAYTAAFDWLYHAAPLAAGNATGAQIEAAQAAGGWVPSGAVASKFITAAGALILMVVLIWRLQNLTHPGPSKWAREEYTADFKGLSPAEKFEVYGRVRLQYVLLAAAALVFAALVV